MYRNLTEHLHNKSVSLIGAMHLHIAKILGIWVLTMSFVSGLRLSQAITPMQMTPSGLMSLSSYMLIIVTPVLAFVLANKVFQPGALLAQPQIRLSRYGRWKKLDCVSSRNHALFGATGMMASLVLGMLLNVPIRSAEFLMSIPALGSDAPLWLSSIFVVMTIDLIVMNSLYVVAFVMAIRHVPWFPRVLLLIWGVDICSQLLIAQWVAATPDVPQSVGSAFSDLLTGNMKKVMISAAIWLPYLLLSERVNITYRGRTRLEG